MPRLNLCVFSQTGEPSDTFERYYDDVCTKQILKFFDQPQQTSVTLSVLATPSLLTGGYIDTQVSDDGF